jgi:hypothetical protein
MRYDQLNSRQYGIHPRSSPRSAPIPSSTATASEGRFILRANSPTMYSLIVPGAIRAASRIPT